MSCIAFALQQTSTEGDLCKLLVGKDGTAAEEWEEPPDQVNLLEAMNPALNPDAKLTQEKQPEPVAAVPNESNKIASKLEDDNGPPVPKSSPSPPPSNAPRIFLQDDDPEFEDCDEEDPDDDLDTQSPVHSGQSPWFHFPNES